MKTVYINGSTLAADELYGIQRFTYELLRELDRFVPKGSVELLVPFDCKKDFGFKNITVTLIEGIHSKRSGLADKLRYRLWNLFGFPMYAQRRGGLSMDLLLTFPLIRCDIFALYDCIFERVERDFDTPKAKLKRALHILLTRIGLNRSRAVITISKNSKRDIMEYYRIPSKKIAIIYTAWQHMDRVTADDSVLERLGLERGSYCFSLGSRHYHKNFRWVAAAARQNPQYTFVVSGSELLNTSDRDLDEGKPDNLIFTGYISDEEVKALMAGCRVFIQPSLYEGAGMPPMEAMSTGAKCIVSNVTSLPELYKGSVWYIDPLKYDGIDIDAIMTGGIEDNRRVLELYSWRRSARKLYAVIEDVRRRSGQK